MKYNPISSCESCKSPLSSQAASIQVYRSIKCNKFELYFPLKYGLRHIRASCRRVRVTITAIHRHMPGQLFARMSVHMCTVPQLSGKCAKNKPISRDFISHVSSSSRINEISFKQNAIAYFNGLFTNFAFKCRQHKANLL